jgi:tetratricopeptide (TPR) repeat protein
MRAIRVLAAAGLAAALTGCAAGIQGSAESISRWEKARADSPKSESVLRSLGIAYYKANRYDDARRTLQDASTLDPNDGVAALYLGLTAEAQNDLPAAHAAYDAYLKVGKTGRVKKQVEDKLASLARKELDAATKQAIAREAQLSSTPGAPNAVAVLPFTFSGADTSLKPLERGFAELLATDLTRVSSLKVLDRARIQAMLDELALQQTGATAEGTGVRAGKILQASQLVGGAIVQQGDQLQTNARLTSTASSQARDAGTDRGALDQVFTIEKNIALSVVTSLGAPITTAERNAIDQRPTRSLQAFLSYSRGLIAEDQGRYDEAGRFFDNAVRLDPSFGAAAQKSQEVRNVSAGNQVTSTTVESGLRGTSEGAAVSSASGIATNVGGALAVAQDLNPSAAGAATGGTGTGGAPPAKDPSSATSADNPTTKTAKVTIVITQPRP